MSKFKPVSWMALLASLAIIALLGCNAKPFDYKPTAGEMKEGPGVFTGEDGELTIYDSKKGGIFPKDSDAKDAETSSEKTAKTTETTGAAVATAAAAQSATETAKTPDKAGEFQDFQEF